MSQPEPLTPAHVAALRAIGAAGALTLSGIVDALDPGVMAAPARDFAKRSIASARVAGSLYRLGLIERRLFSNDRVLTALGRVAVERAAGASTAALRSPHCSCYDNRVR